MSEYGPSSYGDHFADVYDDWYGDVSDVVGTVDRIVALAGDGPVLELGTGTGRLALPLAAAGLRVVGVDASAAMLERFRAKPGADTVTLIEADMAEPPVSAAHFSVAFAAFNTFFNLIDDNAQNSCIRSVARALRPGGCLVIEGFVPPEDGLTDGGVSVREITDDCAVLSASTHDADTQLIRGQHIELSENGIRLRPWVLHYRTPEQLDSAAARHGFSLEDRASDWHGGDWSPSADTHVSVYRLEP